VGFDRRHCEGRTIAAHVYPELWAILSWLNACSRALLKYVEKGVLRTGRETRPKNDCDSGYGRRRTWRL
jgi:hypothetical protein